MYACEKVHIKFIITMPAAIQIEAFLLLQYPSCLIASFMWPDPLYTGAY